MPHEPFPIADYTTGLSLSKEPFLSPNNAYRELTNGRVFRGRLEKRAGYSYFGFLVDPTVLQAGATFSNEPIDQFGAYPTDDYTGKFTTIDPSTTTFTRTQANTTVPGDTMEANLQGFNNLIHGATNDTVTIHATNGPNPGEQIGNYIVASGVFQIDWSGHSLYQGEFGAGDLPVIHYNVAAGLPVTGIANFLRAGVNRLIAFDTLRAYAWSDFNQSFAAQSDGTTTEIFVGASDDYVWTWPTENDPDNYLIITNSVDPVYRWIPDAVPPIELQPVNLDPLAPGAPNGGPDAIDRALIVVQYRGRLVYLNVTEDSQSHFNRARWTIAGSLETFADDGLGWADAPATYGSIRTAGFVADRLMVGFDNGWMELNRTGDPAAPFEWLAVTSKFGAGAKLTTINDGGRLLTRSETSLEAIDPNTQYPVDTDIPDYVAHWSPSQGQRSVASRNEQEREHWWSYVKAGEGEIDSALVAQYDEKNHLSWAYYTLEFTAYGQYEVHQTEVWDNMPGNWSDYTRRTWDDQGITAGFPLFLGGRLDGVVYEIGQVPTDYGTDISFYALTQALTPYPGKSSHMGWVDIYAEAGVDTSVDVTFYDKVGGAGYKTVTVDFSPTDSTSKVYRRVRVGRSAAFHQIAVRQTGDKFFAIDAIIPWFREAGRLENFG